MPNLVQILLQHCNYALIYNHISSAGCKNALSRRPVEERPISAPGSRTTYLSARSKNDLSRYLVEEWPISALDSRTTYLGAGFKNDPSQTRFLFQNYENYNYVNAAVPRYSFLPIQKFKFKSFETDVLHVSISSAGCKNALSRRPVQERLISAPGRRTPYLGVRFKNDLSRRPVQERPISVPGWRTTYLGTRLKNDLSRRRIQERPISNAMLVSQIL